MMPIQTATMRLFLLLVCFLQCLSVVVANFEENCRSRGFDPQQLSCDTCALLPSENNIIKATCLECCQSYKTLHGQPQRYEYAVLLYNGQNEEMTKFVTESLPNIHHQKGTHRLQAMENDGNGAYSVMLTPSKVYWMDQALPNLNGKSLNYKKKILQDMAKEQVTVEGWQKDDLEDMLLTLLQDA